MSETVFTPDERIGLADPVIRKQGHHTQEIVLADEADYTLAATRQDGVSRIDVNNSAYTPGQYRISFDGKGTYAGGDRFEALLTFPPIANGQPWNTVSDGAGSADTTIRVTSILYDHTGGNVEQQMAITCVGPHNLAVGQYVRLRMDSDLTLTTAFATGSTIGAINAEFRVAFITSTVAFSVVFTPGTVDDAADGTLDANLYVNPRANVDYIRQIRNIVLADTESSAAICGDWEGIVRLMNRTEDIEAVFIVDEAGAVSFNVDQWEATGLLLYNTNGADLTQGVEIAANLLNIYNEDGALNEYDVLMENSPIKSEDVNGYACFFVQERNFVLSNRLGQAETFDIERVA